MTQSHLAPVSIFRPCFDLLAVAHLPLAGLGCAHFPTRGSTTVAVVNTIRLASSQNERRLLWRSWPCTAGV